MGELADKLSKLQRLEVTRKHWCQMREGVKSKARGRDTRWKWMGEIKGEIWDWKCVKVGVGMQCSCH